MLHLSKSCQYALRGLNYLVRNPEKGLVKISNIAENENIPTNYLRKIFDRLVKDRIVISTVGPLGGVRLASKKISIASVIETIDGKPSRDACPLLGYKKCPELKPCPIQNECRKLTRSIWKKLKEFKLEDFGYRRF